MGDSEEVSRSRRPAVVAKVELSRSSPRERPASTPISATRGHRGFDPPNLNGLRVLIVEDDADLQALIREQFESYGAVVGAAGSCKEARAALTDSVWNVLIADIGLPDGSGYELALFARALTSPPTCIALSGRGSQDDVDEARRVGFRLHLKKPCDPGTIARVAEHFRPHP